jgi:hypothetical protein
MSLREKRDFRNLTLFASEMVAVHQREKENPE